MAMMVWISIKIKDGNKEQVLKMMDQPEGNSFTFSQKGCERLERSEDHENPNHVLLTELWSSKEDWLDKKTAQEQEPLLNKSWNCFVNTVGQRHLPMISKLYEDILFDIPKAGGVVENGTLKIRQQFPGLNIRYTLDGSEPDLNSNLYDGPVEVSSLSDVVIRVFDINGRGGSSIKIKQK